MRRTAVIIGGTSLLTGYVAVNYVVDVALQADITQLCRINGGSTSRSLRRDTTSKALGVDFLLRSEVDGGLDGHHCPLRLSEVAYYVVNLKVAEMLHRRHYVTLVIECRQDAKSQQPGKLASRATFYVSEAEYRQ